MREGTSVPAPLSPVPLYFSSLSLLPHRFPLSERLEQAMPNFVFGYLKEIAM